MGYRIVKAISKKAQNKLEAILLCYFNINNVNQNSI